MTKTSSRQPAGGPSKPPQSVLFSRGCTARLGPSYYAYCVVRLDADEPWQVFPGIGERPVFAVREQKMAILVSRLERGHLENARSIVQHGQVIYRVFGQRTVLPFRYGTVFSTEEQVGGLLRENRDQFTEAIRFLRGKAEMHVRLLFQQAAEKPRAAAAAAGMGMAGGNLLVAVSPPEVDSGEGQARHLAERVNEAIHPLQEQISMRLGREGQVLLDLRHLVEDERVGDYQGLPGVVLDRIQDCQVQVTGPWPPYHFLPVAVKLPARSERWVGRGERVAARARGALTP